MRAKVASRASVRATGSSRLGARRAAKTEEGELNGVDEGSEPSSASLSDPTQLDYVEVMACPGGCVNGGGQIGIPEGKNQKQWRQELEDIYNSIPQLKSERMISHHF